MKVLTPGQKVKLLFTGQLKQNWNLPDSNEVLEIKSKCPIEKEGYYKLVGYEYDHDGLPQSFDGNLLLSIN